MDLRSERDFGDFDLQHDELDEIIDFAFPNPHLKDEGIKITCPFIEATVFNLGWSRHELAAYSSIHIDLINAILDGEISLSSVNTDVLAEIAHTLGYEGGTIELLMRYDSPPTLPFSSPNEILVEQIINLGLTRDDSLMLSQIAMSKDDYLSDLREQLLQLLLDGLADFKKNDPQHRYLRRKYQVLIERIGSIMDHYQKQIAEIKRKIIDPLRAEYKHEIESMKANIDQLRTAQTVSNIMGLSSTTPSKPVDVRISDTDVDDNIDSL